jgi:2-polyprenyl-3-methyl-5-hydroxy-6-metoxy-1,4-benzoquinol methylase
LNPKLSGNRPDTGGEDAILGKFCRDCYLCGSAGAPLYTGLWDQNSSGTDRWNLMRCVDRSCDLLWLDPMPLETEIEKAYRTYYTHSATRRPTPLRRAYRAIADGHARRRFGYPSSSASRLVGFLAYLHPGLKIHAEFGVWHQAYSGPEERLLDVGCGNGEALETLLRLGWQHLEGIDVDGRAVAVARQRGLNVVQGQLQEANYDACTFDVITMGHVLEHVHDPIALIGECRRILKPGGRIVVATPNAQSLGHAMFESSWLHLDPPRHLYLFSRANLSRILARSGTWSLQVLQTTVHGAGPTLIASRKIRRRKSDRAFHGGITDRLMGQLFYYVEWGCLQLRPNSGEELLLIAARSG